MPTELTTRRGTGINLYGSKCLGFEKYLKKIDEWVNRSVQPQGSDKVVNKPLVIIGPQGSGKRTLMNKWVQFNQEQNEVLRKEDIVLVHYGSSNLKSEENQAIFHICVQLRQILGINQKVELVKEKVKKYFYYWLEMASISIERKCVEG